MHVVRTHKGYIVWEACTYIYIPRMHAYNVHRMLKTEYMIQEKRLRERRAVVRATD
jgi:hypothetical protein